MKDQVLETGTGSFEAVMACLQLREHCRLVGGEKNNVWFQDVLSSLVDVYTKQVLSVHSDRTRSKDALEANKAFVKEMIAPASEIRLIAEMSHPNFFRYQHLLRIYCISLGMCARVQHCLKTVNPFFFCNGLTSGSVVSTARM